MKRPLIVALIALPLLLVGCSTIIGKREPVKVFVPQLTRGTHDDWPRVDWSLTVPRPNTSQSLDSERISVRPDATYTQVYKGAIWSDSVPDLVQSALLHKLEDSGKILAVSRPGNGIRGEYQLATELRSFESIYHQAGAPEATIEIEAKLIHGDDARVVAARNFRSTQLATSEDVSAVVAAFSQALDRSSDDIAAWALVSGQGDTGKK